VTAEQRYPDPDPGLGLDVFAEWNWKQTSEITKVNNDLIQESRTAA